MSGGSNNATIAIPGPDWHMMWTYEFGDFQLDIVGFLAVLGEGSILSVAQVSALSRLFYIPRLLPAPQALLRPTRPNTLPPTDASVTAVSSGNYKDHLHHVAHVLLSMDSGEDEPAFTVRCVSVRKVRQPPKGPTRMDTWLRGSPTRDQTSKSPEYETSPVVKSTAAGPLTYVTLLGALLSLSLFIISIVLGDGMSLLATILLSFLSTLVGFSNKWTLELPKRPQGSEKEEGDVVIRYPNGSYLIVKCDEDVARELFFAPEEIHYEISSATIYRLISLLGTLMLMLGIVFLANAKLQLQFCWAGAYIILNAAHWAAAAVPQRMHWDLSCYSVTEHGVEEGPRNENFTEALWKAILFTRSTAWVRIGKSAAPHTEHWNTWLEQAQKEARSLGIQKGNATSTLWPPSGKMYMVPDPKRETSWRPRAAFRKISQGKLMTLAEVHMGENVGAEQQV
ncbi:hypothetical protein LTR95_012266 [Oleoguttula sp. CCFEE 5521]|uniref:Uncharacterized protein n=1 Tax=Cryoendolithus antarcticus TaxID=1507870 RepID=A0A1V8TF37_9PEZI|nr:hypothetical protein B0A48_04232 [Cryoendolithus antarcticus]